MPPIRVLHMIGCLEVGGSQIMVMNIYRNIDRQKVQFDFIIDNEVESPLKKEIAELGGKIYMMPKFNGKNGLMVRKQWDSFFKKHREYEILHSHVRSYASLYLPIAKMNGLTTIIHSHNTSNGNGITSIAKKILQYPLRYQADYYFACSQYAGEWLFGKKAVERENFKIIANAIDTSKYKYSQKARNKIREEFNISDDTYVIGNIGRFQSQKNHTFIIDCFNEIHKIVKNSILLLVGTGDLKKQIKEKVRKLGLEESVILTGVRKDIPELLFAMDLFLFPSRWEGLGIVAIEAQASGLPVICSDVVPKETKVTNLIKYISLDKPASYWAERILLYKSNANRIDRIQEVKNSGFDIVSISLWLQNFYVKLEKQK